MPPQGRPAPARPGRAAGPRPAFLNLLLRQSVSAAPRRQLAAGRHPAASLRPDVGADNSCFRDLCSEARLVDFGRPAVASGRERLTRTFGGSPGRKRASPAATSARRCLRTARPHSSGLAMAACPRRRSRFPAGGEGIGRTVRQAAQPCPFPTSVRELPVTRRTQAHAAPACTGRRFRRKASLVCAPAPPGGFRSWPASSSSTFREPLAAFSVPWAARRRTCCRSAA